MHYLLSLVALYVLMTGSMAISAYRGDKLLAIFAFAAAVILSAVYGTFDLNDLAFNGVMIGSIISGGLIGAGIRTYYDIEKALNERFNFAVRMAKFGNVSHLAQLLRAKFKLRTGVNRNTGELALTIIEEVSEEDASRKKP